MSDLVDRLEGARDVLQPEWGEKEIGRSFDGFKRRKRRREQVKKASVTVAALAMLVTGYSLFAPMARVSDPGVTVAAGNGDETWISFPEGARALPHTEETVITLSQAEPDLVQLDLEKGLGTFEVAPNRKRRVQVVVDNVIVEVIGTRFRVERADRRVYVGVERGKVQVTWPGGKRALIKGDDGWFSMEDPESPANGESEIALEEVEPAPEAADIVDAAVAKEELTESPSKQTRQVRRKWKKLANQGSYEDAYEVLRKKPEIVRDIPNELMLAADVARLSGHPADAIPHLNRVLKAYASDARSPMAAFTLGRLQLEKLGDPKTAAEAFAKVSELAPGGPLAEDAMAREVEAWSKAGRQGRALKAAEAYIDRYPDGRRLDAVRRFGGLD